MGNIFTLVYSLIFHSGDTQKTFGADQPFQYAIFDPTQVIKPAGRSKDLISIKNKKVPLRLDREKHAGCDTVWKCFKRSAWKCPNREYLGIRQKLGDFLH